MRADFVDLDDDSRVVWSGELDVLPQKGHAVALGPQFERRHVTSVEWVLQDPAIDLDLHVLVNFRRVS